MTLLTRGVHAMLPPPPLPTFVPATLLLRENHNCSSGGYPGRGGNISLGGNNLYATATEVAKHQFSCSRVVLSVFVCMYGCMYVPLPNVRAGRGRGRGREAVCFFFFFFRCVYGRYIGYIVFCISSVRLRMVTDAHSPHEHTI